MRDNLKNTAMEKEEQQQHLVSKYMQTEGKLGQWAGKLVIVTAEFEQDLERLHNRLSKVKGIEGDKKDTSRILPPHWRWWWARCARRWTSGKRSTRPAATSWGIT